MKKVFLMVMAVAALTFTSCGNKTNPNANADSAAVDTTLADSLKSVLDGGDASAIPATFDGLKSQLAEKLGAKDGEGFTTLLANAKAKIAELVKSNPEQAKQYVSQLQQYITSHANEIQAITKGNATIAAAVSEVKSLDPENVVKSLSSAAANDAANIGADAANNAKNKVEEKVSEKVNAAAEKVEATKNAVQEKASNAANKAAETVSNAANKASEKTNEAVNKATDKAIKGLGL